MHNFEQDKAVLKHAPLTDEQREMVAEIEALGESMGELYKRLAERPDIDQRWLAEGRTDLQKGKMSLIRAVCRPAKF